MAEHLTEKEVKTAVRLIEGWEGKLTWQKLVDKLTAETGRSEAPTRQTLYSHENIATAWHAIKHRVKNKSPRAPSLAMADNMIERRDAQQYAQNGRDHHAPHGKKRRQIPHERHQGRCPIRGLDTKGVLD